VMFAVRISTSMREAIRERAQDEDVSEAELVERIWELGLEADGRPRRAL
jgi:hypothetical protein